MAQKKEELTDQEALTIGAATVGFVSAVYFSIGSITSTAKTIVGQASTYWDFNEDLAVALASQRAQFLVGALLLVASFGLQVAATQASTTTAKGLPQDLQSWLPFVVAVLLGTIAATVPLYFWISRATRKEVLHLARGNTEESP